MATTIRAVSRALELLRLMDEDRDFGIAELRTRSGLPKATVFRLLATLEAEGYVTAEHPAGTYRLSGKVVELSRGVSERSLLVQAAAPILEAETRAIKWPLALGIPEGGRMVVRLSSMPVSPLAVQTTTRGHRHDLLASALGQAYLAFCGQTERQTLLALAGHAAGDEHDVSRLLDGVRSRGYGLRLPRSDDESGTFAVPVRRSDDAEVAAALSITTFGRLMTPETIARHLPVLTRIAADIAAAHAVLVSIATPGSVPA